MRLLNDNKLIIDDVDNNNNIVIININVIILLYKISIKRVNKIIKRTRKLYSKLIIMLSLSHN